MLPVVEFPPATPSTIQETAVLDSFVTEAVNCCVPEDVSVAEAGETEIDGGVGVSAVGVAAVGVVVDELSTAG